MYVCNCIYYVCARGRARARVYMHNVVYVSKINAPMGYIFLIREDTFSHVLAKNSRCVRVRFLLTQLRPNYNIILSDYR